MSRNFPSDSITTDSLEYLGYLIGRVTPEVHDRVCRELDRRVAGSQTAAVHMLDFHYNAFKESPRSSEKWNELVGCMALVQYKAQFKNGRVPESAPADRVF
jgi:hypothetical protein